MITVLAIIGIAYLIAGLAVAVWILTYTNRHRAEGELHPAILLAVTVAVWPWSVWMLRRYFREARQEETA
jgi:hypothetical protein